MRLNTLLCASVLVLSLPASLNANANAISQAQLLQHGGIADTQVYAFVSGTLSGIDWTSNWSEADGIMPLYCPPADTGLSAEALWSLVDQFLRQQSRYTPNDSFGLTAIAALQQQFPCDHWQVETGFQ